MISWLGRGWQVCVESGKVVVKLSEGRDCG